jgi:dienelactone hydrolase
MATSSPSLTKGCTDHCFTTVQHYGTPAGRTDVIAGVETYISEPKVSSGTKKVVLFFADVYGPLYLNNQLIQDYFASHGYTVLGPDYFFGDPIYLHNGEVGFEREPWMEKSMKRAKEAVPKWLEAVKELYGTATTKYTTVGHCFGAPFVMDLAATDFVVAAAFAHPAFLTEDQFKNLKKPLFLSCAEIDSTFDLQARRRAEDIMVEIKAVYHIQVFSSVVHGFAIRGDPAHEHTGWAKEESARGILQWFERFVNKAASASAGPS